MVAADGPALGHVVVKPASPGVAEVGCWTAAHARGRGIAARAVDAMSHWALDVQDVVELSRLHLLHAVAHAPVETYSNGVRHVEVLDPDGNSLSLAALP